MQEAITHSWKGAVARGEIFTRPEKASPVRVILSHPASLTAGASRALGTFKSSHTELVRQLNLILLAAFYQRLVNQLHVLRASKPSNYTFFSKHTHLYWCRLRMNSEWHFHSWPWNKRTRFKKYIRYRSDVLTGLYKQMQHLLPLHTWKTIIDFPWCYPTNM